MIFPLKQQFIVTHDSLFVGGVAWCCWHHGVSCFASPDKYQSLEMTVPQLAVKKWDTYMAISGNLPNSRYGDV